MLFGALRGRRARIARSIVELLAVILTVIIACWAVLTLRSSDQTVMFTVLVFAGSAVTLGFVLAPMIGGAVDPLDPRRFTLLGLQPGTLAGSLLLAGLLSVPIAALTAVTVSTAVVWSEHGASWFVVGLGALLAVATCVLFARVCMALASAFLSDRRSRELSGLFVLAVIVVFVPVGVFLASLDWGTEVPTALVEAAGALAWTPFGAVWAFPSLAAAGDGTAWQSLAIAVLTIVVLVLAWFRLVAHAMTTAERPVSVRERGGLGWFAVAPHTPGGAVAARSLLYWTRDRRYIVNALVIPFAAAVTMVPLLVAGMPLEQVVLIPVPFAALFLGWLPHNDLAYDSTAIWMHIASGVRGIPDRFGRLVPVVLLGVPLLAVAIPVTISVHGRWALLPALTGVCAALFLSGLGLSSIASVVSPYAASRPGESPFQQPQRTGSSGFGSQSAVLFGAIAVSAPALWLGWLAFSGDIEQAIPAMWTGVVTGVVVLLIGVGIGALVFERGGTRLMEFAAST